MVISLIRFESESLRRVVARARVSRMASRVVRHPATAKSADLPLIDQRTFLCFIIFI